MFRQPVELEKASVLVLVTSRRSWSASTRRLDSGRTPAPRLSLRRRFYRGSFAAPKSRYGQRTIPLTPGLARSLWELRKNAGVAEGELVFTSETGTVIDSSNLASRVLKPAARKAGVGWAGFHTLRHTCATILFRHGLNAKQVQVWMGHHSPAFTLATYVHLLPDDLPAASFLDAVTAPGPRATDGQQDEPRTTETPKPLIALAPPNEAETSDVPSPTESAAAYF